MKYIFCILFLITASYSYASENSCPGVSGTLSYYTKEYQNNRIFSTDVGLWYHFNITDNITITPYGGVKTWFVQNGYIIYGGNPFRDSYYIGVNIELYKFNLIFDHYCEHPVYSGDDHWEIFNTYYEDNWLQTESSSLTKIGIVYSTNILYLDFKIFLNMAIKSDAFYEAVELSHTFSLPFDLKLIPYFKLSLWTDNERLITQTGIILNWKEVYLIMEYYESIRNRYHQENEHLYEEYPLQSKVFSISIQYKIN